MLGLNIGNDLLLRLLGEDSMGMVFAILNDSAGGRATTKFPRPDVTSRHDITARVLGEVKATNSISYPGIAPSFDCEYTASDVANLTMAYLDDESLWARLARRTTRIVAVSPRSELHMASAWRAAHRRIEANRDPASDNIMMVKDLNHRRGA